jgi:hypothetical protein
MNALSIKAAFATLGRYALGTMAMAAICMVAGSIVMMGLKAPIPL